MCAMNLGCRLCCAQYTLFESDARKVISAIEGRRLEKVQAGTREGSSSMAVIRMLQREPLGTNRSVDMLAS